jgi:putative ABC transport system ATP-binding protein
MLIEIKELHKRYGEGEAVTEALHDVSFHVKAGEMVAIMGPSGSGKSTLLNILGCLDVPNDGEYRLDGTFVQKLSKKELALVRNQKIGFVFQNFALLSEYTALENVMMPLSYRRAGTRKDREKALQALTAVGMKAHVDKQPSQLSGGQQQRVAIARALVGDTPILLADEPTGALDQKTGEEIMELLQSIHAQGKTVIIVTHDPKVAKLCQRVILMQDGTISNDQTLAPLARTTV